MVLSFVVRTSQHGILQLGAVAGMALGFVYLCAGILTWNLFAEIVQKAGQNTTRFDVQLTPDGMGRVAAGGVSLVVQTLGRRHVYVLPAGVARPLVFHPAEDHRLDNADIGFDHRSRLNLDRDIDALLAFHSHLNRVAGRGAATLHFDIHLCLWLSVATVIATGVTVYLLWQGGTTRSVRSTTQTPGIDPHAHVFRFGWTYVHGLETDRQRIFFYLAPKLTDELNSRKG